PAGAGSHARLPRVGPGAERGSWGPASEPGPPRRGVCAVGWDGAGGPRGRSPPDLNGCGSMTDRRRLLTVACAMSFTAVGLAQNDWRTYGNDPGHARFSTLTQITPQNVTRLTRTWEFDTKTPGRKWQNTAVVINNIMYITLQNG